MMSKVNKKCRSAKWMMTLSTAICVLLLLGGCNQMAMQKKKDGDLAIKDIAYDVTGKEDCLVYIEENGFFFLIL